MPTAPQYATTSSFCDIETELFAADGEAAAQRAIAFMWRRFVPPRRLSRGERRAQPSTVPAVPAWDSDHEDTPEGGLALLEFAS